MVDQRELDQVFAYVEHDQGDVLRELDQIFAYVEHDQGDVQRELDQLIAYMEVLQAASQKYGPGVQISGRL